MQKLYTTLVQFELRYPHLFEWKANLFNSILAIMNLVTKMQVMISSLPKWS